MSATSEQAKIIEHDPSTHGRVLAGPGTGKSWTAIQLLERLSDQRPGLSVKLLTFTRAATKELVNKVEAAQLENLNVQAPSTIHSFALSILLSNPQLGVVPLPLVIPDDWEQKVLIRPDLARRLRKRGFEGANADLIYRLEEEMACGWQALDPELILLSQVDARLRNAYVGLWREHRGVFGYTLQGELPFQAVTAIHDYELRLDGLDFVIVDEYQDLNKADIRLIEALASQGIRILAVGDDDQSIYGFRMAAPEGIRSFPQDFDIEISSDYTLSVSLRCKPAILDAANSLIESDPQRPVRPKLTQWEHTDDAGTFAYLRFDEAKSEREGVCRIIETRLKAGVGASDIAVLVRSSVASWAKEWVPEFERRGIEVATSSWVDTALSDPELRQTIATARLAIDRSDSLAWWTLFHLRKGVSRDRFCDLIYEARRPSETFGDTLLRMDPYFEGATPKTARIVADMILEIDAVRHELEGITTDNWSTDQWFKWFVQQAQTDALGDEARQFLELVQQSLPEDLDLRGLLSQIQPIAKDLANASSEGVRMMTMSSSKGLTFDTVIVVGVEQGIMPLPFPKGDTDEERRLLYVAMTRATDMCILTFAARRAGGTSRLGQASRSHLRGRSPLLHGLSIGEWMDGPEFVQSLEVDAVEL